ncbi:uncharacterized protein LOC18994044 isoform X2 [Eutrema salsugineum]|uniref:uncharacterized protein LOC18994044 isoform X2 n=1 Tax=Eutrema salsugineum TaxID=72664 RepID=UPI000CED3EEF|nr:uncharacterized protein LOC18994044 isoform X2 [Eutrema salsugineum]
MQRNRDGSWSLGASANGGRGVYLPQATRGFSDFNVRQPISYNFQAQQNLNFPHRQIPSFPSHQFGAAANVFLQPHAQSVDSGGSRFHGSSEKSSSKSRRNVEVNRIDEAVNEKRKSVIASGESVSSTRVSQSVLAQLQADSFGVQMQDVPSLRQLMALEGKINAFIHCFIGARRIVTLHDLEVAICRNEFVDCFDDLELGPLLQHPLVLLYFPSISGSIQITSEEIVSFLDSYLDTYDMDDVQLDEFLNFVAEKKSVSSKEKLGVRIQSLRMYVSFIQDAKRQEGETLKILRTELHQKYHILSSKRQQQDKSLTVSDHADLFASHPKDYCGKHTRFNSSSSDDNDSGDCEVENVNNADHFSSCPYPPVAEEMKQLGSSKKKRKVESCNLEKSSKLLRRGSSKLRRGHVKEEIPKSADDSDAKQVFDVNEADFTRSEGALRLFLSTWKDTCKELSMSMFVEKMLSFYNLGGSEVQPQIKRAKAMSSFPFVGLLHVAELVTEALEEQIPIAITKPNLVSGYDNCEGMSTRADKANPLRPMSVKSGSTSGNLVQEWSNSASTDFGVRDGLRSSTPWAAQAQQTGRKGEEIAYRYFAAKYGKEAVVSWVNEQSETGLPYDLIIKNRGGKEEYVEVKATVSTGKDYFNLTVKEWEFANEKGESYVIAHVLLGNSNAILTQHRNLVRLCQDGHLRLLILMPNQRTEVTVAF